MYNSLIAMLANMFPCHLGPKQYVEMVFNDIIMEGEEAIFNIGLYVFDASATLYLLFDYDWFNITLVLVFDYELPNFIKEGCIIVGRFAFLLVRNMITLDMEGRSVAEACVQRRAT